MWTKSRKNQSKCSGRFPKERIMVSTKHCCWGECKTDSRYPDKWPKSLKEMEQSGKKVFIPFPKPSQDIMKCKRWMLACSRQFFTENSITRNTYICALHWPGEKGPTAEFPDPLKANFTPAQAKRASAPKRKAPPSRAEPAAKKDRIVDEYLDEEYLGESIPSFDELEEIPSETAADLSMYESPVTGKMVLDQGMQTVFTKYELSAKVDAMILKNEVSTMRDQGPKIVSSLSYEAIGQDPDLMKHFVGLSPQQFKVLYNFLNDVCPLESINYWNFKESSESEKANTGRKSEFSTQERLFICLLRLRRGFTIKTLAALLSSPGRKIEQTQVRIIFTTHIQLMYKIFRDMQAVMFPNRTHLRRFIPKVFKTIKNIRCIVDCTEFPVECSRNFARQGNTFSSYKHTNTFKCLIAVTPNGGACFVSDLFEGDIDDVQIFKKCGILRHLHPYDLVMADRGFTVQDLLNPIQVELKIPSFLKGRGSLTAAEELETRRIAKARIHVERFNERLKQFKLVGRKIPLSIAPLATQLVVVAACLVNFQETLCK